MKSFSNVLGDPSGTRADEHQTKSGGFLDMTECASLSEVARTALAAAANRKSLVGDEGDRKYSLSTLWALAMEIDGDVDDELAKAQKRLGELKDAISIQSKKNFILEKNVRVLDNRIALLIQNHMALDESQDLRNISGVGVEVRPELAMRDPRRRQLYGHLFFLLQSEPKYLAALMNHIKMDEIDGFLEVVMFTIYGNQYDTREELLLLKMLRFVLSETWEDTPSRELGNLLRSNNPVSKIITAYTRRGPGQTYLKNKLHELVDGITKSDADLEINPDVICKNLQGTSEVSLGINPENPSEDPQIGLMIDERAAQIIKATSSCVDKIIGNVDDIPYGIRWICKQIKSLVKRNYSDLSQDDLSVIIGGVFFLRFINPAITVPETTGLINTQVNKRQRRALTLVSKIIQSASNKPTQSREAYMSVFNPLVESLKTPVNKFLSDICSVGDFFDALEMEQYIALTKKQLKMNISLQDIHFIHQLLNKYCCDMLLDDDDRLKKCLAELNSGVLASFNKLDNKVFSLELIRNWDCLSQESSRSISATEFTKRDVLYMDTKALCIQVIRSVPSLSKNVSHRSSASSFTPKTIAETACSSRNSALFKKGMRLKELIKELELTYQSSLSPNFNQVLCEEIRNELESLGSLKDRVDNEIRSLLHVNKNLTEQYKYLMAQLESYKAYLVNVRSQSGSSKVASKSKPHHQGPLRLSYAHLDRDGTITASQIPESCRGSTFFHFYTPAPGSYSIAIRYIGRQEDILQMKLSLDDLLEKQESGDDVLDLDCVKLSVAKVLQLINKHFLKR